jgi:hypothetical protein
MSNPSLTAEALRNLISEVVAEALAKRPDTAARSALPKAERERVDYEALAIKAFRKAGYGEIKPRIDTKTYNLWLADGLKVKPGEHAVKVRNLRLFHRSQVEAMSAAEKREALGALKAKAEGTAAAPTPAPKAAEKATPKAAEAVPVEGSGLLQ